MKMLLLRLHRQIQDFLLRQKNKRLNEHFRNWQRARFYGQQQTSQSTRPPETMEEFWKRKRDMETPEELKTSQATKLPEINKKQGGIFQKMRGAKETLLKTIKVLNMKKSLVWPLHFIAAAMLLLAVGKMPYDYYNIMRLVVCVIGGICTYYALTSQFQWVGWVFILIVVLFNPIMPMHLEKDSWRIANIVAAGWFTISVFLIRSRASEPEEN